MTIENNYEPKKINPSISKNPEITEKDDWTLQYLTALTAKEKLMTGIDKTKEKTPEEIVTEVIKQTETEFGKLTATEIKDLIKCFQDAANGKKNQIGLVDISKGEIHRREQDTKNLLETMLPDINKIIGQNKTNWTLSGSGITNQDGTKSEEVVRIYVNPKEKTA